MTMEALRALDVITLPNGYEGVVHGTVPPTVALGDRYGLRVGVGMILRTQTESLVLE